MPVPAGAKSWFQAPWRDVLLWASAGKLGAVPDALYFPSAEQAARLREFLERQGAAGLGPLRFGEGLLHARLHLRMPADLALLVPGKIIERSAGAFWAPAEAAQWHRALLYNEGSRVSPLLMAMAYSHPESPWLMLPEAARYAVATQALAREALSTPGLRETAFGALKTILAEERATRIRGLLEQGQAGAAVKELSPSELFMLGRLLSDAPELNRYQLASLRALRSIAGRVAVQGTAPGDFRKELDALLSLPGGGSAASAPLERYGALSGESWAMQRRLVADLLLQVLAAMEQEKIPPRFLPLILPRAVETVERGSSRAASAQDWGALLKALRKVTRGKARAWVYDQTLRGYAAGRPLGTGLLKRDLPALLEAELGSALAAAPYDEKKVVGGLGFASGLEADLKTFKSGSFRVDLEEGHYRGWKAGDLVKIMAGKKAGRRALFTTRLRSVEKKRLGDLTLEDLEAEFAPTRFWNPVDDEEALRRELIAELIRNLRLFHPGVDENTEGLMIQFDPYPAVKTRQPR